MAVKSITTVKNVKLGIQSGTTNTVYATWDWSAGSSYTKHFDHYEIIWMYKVAGVWYYQSPTSNSGVSNKSSTFSPQANADTVKIKIKPVAETHSVTKKTGEKDSKGKEKTKSVTEAYWKASYKTASLKLPTSLRIDTPSAPEVTLDSSTGLKMAVTYKNTNVAKPTRIQFQVVKNDTSQAAMFLAPIDAAFNYASYTMGTVEPGVNYKVRCRAVVGTIVTTSQGTGKYETVLVDVTRTVTTYEEQVDIQTIYSHNKPYAVATKELVPVNKQVATGVKKYVTREITTKRETFKPTYYSEWSEFSSSVGTYPKQVGNVVAQSRTSSSVLVAWDEAAGAKGYEVQWVKDNPDYFRTAPSEINKSEADLENPTCSRELMNFDNVGGPTYYFRVRGVNDEGNGEWSEIVSCRLATIPDAPTTWSYITTAVIGDSVDLNWVHNSEDNSAQEKAQILLTVNGTNKPVITINGETCTYLLDTSTGYSDGDVIEWKVRTKGIPSSPDGGYGPWSTSRRITVYAPPSVEISIRGGYQWLWDPFNFNTDTIYTAESAATEDIDDVESFPFDIVATAYPASQSAISMTISIITNDTYDTLDPAGNTVKVMSGESVYSEYFSPETNSLTKRMTPGDIDLEDGVSYTLHVTVSMNTGLSASAELDFNVFWEDPAYEPNAMITIDETDLSCMIRPFCINDEGEEELNAILSVYRREYDGTFKLISGGLEASDQTTVTDPHPSLDYARYRIVAQSKTTGGLSYQDLEGVPIGYSAVVITWDEIWRNFNNLDDDGEEIIDMQDGGVSGSMLTLPYNIDVNADYAPSVELVEYIGREHPVSYYGTQKGETAKWSVEVPKDDVETIYQIRRLAVYAGDVYVREPSGTGYWAQVKVSYQINHNKPIVPVTFNITRVEGGV